MWENLEQYSDQVREMSWWWNKARSEIVYTCMKNIVLTGGRVLDIGAGYGSMSMILKEYGDVTAIEPSPAAAAFLQESMRITTYCGDLNSFQDSSQFHIVACLDVLEHIEDDCQALLRISSLINDGGFLVLTVPAYMFLWSKHDELNHHYRRYTKKELVDKLPSNCIIRKVTYYNTLLFPAAVIDKLFLSKQKASQSLKPNKIINEILYIVFSMEKYILRWTNLPVGVSILLIAQIKHTN